MTEQALTGNFWTDLKGALLGSQLDCTRGDLGKTIVLLAVPMVLELAMQSVFGLFDVFFVARLGSAAVAAVGITESVLTIVFALALGLSMGTTALVARRTGEGHAGEASIAAVQSVWLSILISVPVSFVGYFYSRQVLAVMGASSDVLSVGVGYTEVILISNLAICLLFVINAIFRGAGDPVYAMWALWIANLWNIVLDPLLIFGIGPFPEMGVTGAALATAIGRAVGVVFQLWVLFSGRSRLQITAHHWHLNIPVLKRLLRISIGGVLQFLIATASWLALVRIIAWFGSAALAGYTIAIRILIFALLPSWGMSNAAATLVGQNLGAGQPGRAERSVWITCWANMAFLGLVTVFFVIWAEPISGFFTGDTAVLGFAVDGIRYISYGYIFYALGMVMVQAFNGAGDTFTPSVINFFCYWLFQIPLAYVLALHWQAQGVFAAIAISESFLAVVAYLVFRRGGWKQRIL